MRENISVTLRVRPLNSDEQSRGEDSVLQCHGSQVKVGYESDTGKAGQTYHFDRIFNISSTQQDVYNEIGAAAINQALKGMLNETPAMLVDVSLRFPYFTLYFLIFYTCVCLDFSTGYHATLFAYGVCVHCFEYHIYSAMYMNSAGTLLPSLLACSR